MKERLEKLLVEMILKSLTITCMLPWVMILYYALIRQQVKQIGN